MDKYNKRVFSQNAYFKPLQNDAPFTVSGLSGIETSFNCSQFCFNDYWKNHADASPDAKKYLSFYNPPDRIFADGALKFCKGYNIGAAPQPVNDCYKAITSLMAAGLAKTKDFMVLMGVIFIVIGISCFCYIHKYKHHDDSDEAVEMVKKA